MFLSAKELSELTGYNIKSKQIQFLVDNGITYYANKHRVMTTWHFINHPNEDKLSKKKPSEPNFEALRHG